MGKLCFYTNIASSLYKQNATELPSVVFYETGEHIGIFDHSDIRKLSGSFGLSLWTYGIMNCAMSPDLNTIHSKHCSIQTNWVQLWRHGNHTWCSS